ncbi:selenium cofactor biosynthesis protein YqeC [Intestinibacillus sp. NTUH-41-i26]|uniref:selenium cofactor biosynthesis protein YqeC n=1 Tax=Intestinibacillus sp. NTUH-41-i26 TaxID=3079303 RepID=UPI0029350B34|nr:selenium cofactor biosynthesis protein YqeC [Intestinibacillus sp. NTUH-41-i26]WOC76787.1 selenium cofactor biosynthesis protein YqeC [Intestinibacillus sp. NTUH-41-i26]
MPQPAARSPPIQLQEQLRRTGVTCAGTRSTDGKMGALPAALLQQSIRASDITLCEADGAHGLPLKLHRPDEPVLPPQTSLCLIVAGLSALGRPVGAAVHRYQLHPVWAQAPSQRIGPQTMISCIRETVAAVGLPPDKLRVFLNQSDLTGVRPQAKEILQALSSDGLDCRMGSLHDTPAHFIDWLLPLT